MALTYSDLIVSCVPSMACPLVPIKVHPLHLRIPVLISWCFR